MGCSLYHHLLLSKLEYPVDYCCDKLMLVAELGGMLMFVDSMFRGLYRLSFLVQCRF